MSAHMCVVCPYFVYVCVDNCLNRVLGKTLIVHVCGVSLLLGDGSHHNDVYRYPVQRLSLGMYSI